jgi:hypothetical protein
MREVVAELTRHVGGRPSSVQKLLIDRAAKLHLRLLLMDAQTEPGGGMSEKNAREYLCWSNAYTRTLCQLGLQGTPERPETLADVLATHGDRMAPSTSRAPA